MSLSLYPQIVEPPTPSKDIFFRDEKTSDTPAAAGNSTGPGMLRTQSENSLPLPEPNSWQVSENLWPVGGWSREGRAANDSSLVCTSRPLEKARDPLFPEELFTKDQLRKEDRITVIDH